MNTNISSIGFVRPWNAILANSYPRACNRTDTGGEPLAACDSAGADGVAEDEDDEATGDFLATPAGAPDGSFFAAEGGRTLDAPALPTR